MTARVNSITPQGLAQAIRDLRETPIKSEVMLAYPRSSSTMRRPEMARAVCTIIAAGLLAGCGGDEDETVLAAPVPPAELSVRVEVAKFKYVPRTVDVRVGGTVTWTNRDSAPHTSTSDDGAMEDFDTRRYDGGERARVRFDTLGRFAYYCRFHPFMTGTVEVVE